MKLNRRQLRRLIAEELDYIPVRKRSHELAGNEASGYATAVYRTFSEVGIPVYGHAVVYPSPDTNSATMKYDGEEILTLYGNGAVSLSGNPQGTGAKAAQQALIDNKEVLFDYIEQEMHRKERVSQDRRHIDGY